MSRPLIGITAGLRRIRASTGEHEPAHTLWPTYTGMVREAGGIPVLVTPGLPDEAPEVLDRLDGLLLSGGGDIDPGLYDGIVRPRVYGIDRTRDLFEIAMAQAARTRRFPTLCICRGMQVMNVALGGTLIEDLLDDDPARLQHWVDGKHAAQDSQHEVIVEPGSTTAKALGADTLVVNSIHHQAVRTLGESLAVSAVAPDGVIEAVEPTDRDWPMWAVQWHPEQLGTSHDPSIRLFKALIDAAR
ncbi:MAG: gamma-glutamyl-gamma-aminobutyrate hydrolase family protein [Actinomycetota bacterium]|nr:gamma-glutamyl-gamma-aminobutyrate hydrolase family protein [Actinomycetota bacterium]